MTSALNDIREQLKSMQIRAVSAERDSRPEMLRRTPSPAPRVHFQDASRGSENFRQPRTFTPSARLVKKTKIQIQPLKISDNKILISAGGNPMSVIGKILLPIKLNGLSIPFEFSVIENVTHDCIIGMPFLAHSKANIDLSNHRVTFYDDMVSVNVYTNYRTT
jgi:hypothetical protein